MIIPPIGPRGYLPDNEVDHDSDFRYELLCQAKTVVDSLHSYGETDSKIWNDTRDVMRTLVVAVLADIRREIR